MYFETRVRNVRSESTKVVDFGTNRKRVCDFPLVLLRNRPIAGFLLKTAPHPYSTRILGVPFGL